MSSFRFPRIRALSVVISKLIGAPDYRSLQGLDFISNLSQPHTPRINSLGKEQAFPPFEFWSSFHQITTHKATACSRTLQVVRLLQSSSASTGFFVEAINERSQRGYQRFVEGRHLPRRQHRFRFGPVALRQNACSRSRSPV